MKNLMKTASAIIVLAMIASATGCDAVKKIGKKSSIDNDMVLDAAEDYSKALIDLDAKKLEDGAWELKDSTKELIDGFKFGDESKDVYEEWLKTFKYELEEDDIEIKEDEASIPVTFEYVDIESITTESSTADEWIAAIKDSKKTKELSIDFDFAYDEEEEGIFVDNADKVIKKFYDVVNTYIYVNTYVYYDDAVKAEFTKDEYKADEALSVKITCAKIDALEDKDLNVKISDPSYTKIYECSVVFHSEAVYTIDITAKDCKLDAFKSGYYSLEVDNEDSTLYENDSAYVEEAATPTPTPTEEPEETDETDESKETDETSETKETKSGSDNVNFKTPDSKTFGSYDNSSFTYKNTYFDFKFSIPEDYLPIDPSLLGDSAGNEFKIDFLAADSSMSTLVMVMIAQFDDIGGMSAEDMIAMFSVLEGSENDKVEKVKVGDLEMYAFANDEGVNNYVLFKESSMVVLACQAMSGETDPAIVETITKTVTHAK